MILLVEKLSKIYFKLENHLHHHHHHEQEALQASLQVFQSDVSVCLNQLGLASGLKPGSKFLSLSWVQQCFEVLQVINKAFAKLVVDLDYPMSQWEQSSVEEYLNYSLSLLELLNLISSSISHLGQARLALSHALELLETSPSLAKERFKAFHVKGSNKEFKEPENKEDGDERIHSNRERIVYAALMEMKNIGFWVCGVVLAGLSGDAKPYLEMRKSGTSLSNSALSGLDSSVFEVVNEKGDLLKEVRELNESAACLAAAIDVDKSSDAAEELKSRLEVFEMLLDNIGKEVDHLFSKLLAGRNQLLDGIRVLD